MKNIEIPINKDKSGKVQWLTDVLPDSIIPSNVILFKTLPGIGATYSELFKADRNSIIIEPNVPVIKGKRTKKRKTKNTSGVLGICKGIYTQDVIGYLSNTDVEYKKIMVTPESYHKVVKAAEVLGIDIYMDYFLLYDECDRTSKDIDYRETIIAPMEDFFKFKQKAFVSATAIRPSDPEFEKQGFSKMIIKPQFDYSKELTLIKTNNVFSSTKKLIEDLNLKSKEETYCIFLNSINGILALVKHLNIVNSDYTIFCSTDKKYLLNSSQYGNVKDDIDNSFTKYNFFTSRFYSAVDIYMKESEGIKIIKPIVIMLTQLHIAEHTIIDPTSDAVQIVGRFRDGISKAYAITNINKNIKYKDAENSKQFLNESRIVYEHIRALYKGTTTEGGKEVLGQALEMVHYSRFVKEDGEPNYYMHDNFHYKEYLKSLYTDWEKLKEAYHIDHFKVTSNKEEAYSIDDSLTTIRIRKPLYRNLVTAVCNELNAIENRNSDMLFVLDNTNDLLNELVTDFPLIVRGYKMLGMEETIKIGTSDAAIENAINVKHYSDAKGNFEFIKTLNRIFPVGTKMLLPDLKQRMEGIIEMHGLSLIPTKKLIEEYFELSGRKIINEDNKKGFEILGHRFLGQ